MVVAIGAVLKAGGPEQRMGCLIARHDMGDEFRARHLFPDQDQGRLGQSQAVAIRRNVDGNLPDRRGAFATRSSRRQPPGSAPWRMMKILLPSLPIRWANQFAVLAQGRGLGIAGKFTRIRMDLPLIEQQFIVLRRWAQRYRSAAFGFGALQG